MGDIMSNWQKHPKYFLTLAAVCLLIAIVSLSGIFYMKDDLVGRFIFFGTWALVAIGWLGQYHNSKNITKS